MDRLNEINARLAEINAGIDAASGEALTALEREVNELFEERAALMNEHARKQQVRGLIAERLAGTPSGAATPEPESDAQTGAAEAVAAIYRMAVGVGDARVAILTTGNLVIMDLSRHTTAWMPPRSEPHAVVSRGSCTERM